jgi:hypothetical protein
MNRQCPSAIRCLVRAVALLSLATPSAARAEVQQAHTGAFITSHRLTLPGRPEVIYDALTGDLRGWWDHTFSNPRPPSRFFLEAKPGGGFYEYFDPEGKDGVRHATVIYAHRGKLLRFEGPLGLSGNAVTFVTTYAFEPVGADSTTLTVTAHCAGEFQESWPNVVDGVWHHFIVERFKPYVEAGKHLKK